jgi:hypothetical protein
VCGWVDKGMELFYCTVGAVLVLTVGVQCCHYVLSLTVRELMLNIP